MYGLILALVLAAPVPKMPPKLEVAPQPREMFPYYDEQGKLKYYARERIVDGKKQRAIREGDPEFERRFEAVPVPPNGVVPEV